ncbi:GPW/gp25 family protein [Archangium violaceum]|uniref:Baseplate protein n=1 Tax=Archangium violaceum Cb vi76 TaxID=1406225 RepID=A0A084T291_9BACT|nr:GPW/gp25 family protein [Archangium violaceum]KFA94826.1 baseplate protein [Archangium violaceum Cb vi76]
MATDFLGRGWSFPVMLDTGSGQIAMSQEEEKIRQSIWLILSTAPGERAMRPDFGCGIHALVFENIGAGTRGRLASEVTQALTLWEPRIELDGVDVRPDADEPGRLLITVTYVVRGTNSRFNFVYPFYVS